MPRQLIDFLIRQRRARLGVRVMQGTRQGHKGVARVRQMPAARGFLSLPAGLSQ
jgi:hypothetical protein